MNKNPFFIIHSMAPGSNEHVHLALQRRGETDKKGDLLSDLRLRLTTWYDQHARTLPWRLSSDPYAIWVSETMLQQTRVQTVERYYQRFLDRFPTTTALAGAAEDDVMSAWSGLGYYRRARLLHAAAREIVEHYGGQVPRDAKARRALPGVGAYTAGAVGSIAYGLPEPIVDGNVARVLCRLFDIDTPLRATTTQRRLWSLAQDLVQGPRPGVLNQAMMELGATVCLPKLPRCDSCPVQSQCIAFQNGTSANRPLKDKRRTPTAMRGIAIIAMPNDGESTRVWLCQQRSGLFRGTWGCPIAFAPRDLGEPVSESARNSALLRLAKQTLAEIAPSAKLLPTPAGEVEHLLTHRLLRLRIFRAQFHGDSTSEEGRFFDRDAFHTVGVAKLTVKILRSASIDATVDPPQKSVQPSGSVPQRRRKTSPR